MKSSYSGYDTTNGKETDIWDTNDNDNDNEEDNDNDNQLGNDEKYTPIPFLRRMKLASLPWIQFYRPLGALHSLPDNVIVQGTVDDIHLILYRLRILATACAAVSAFFWGWAVINTKQMEKGIDLGVYSFATTLISSHWILWRTLHGPVTGQYLATIPIRVVVTASQVLVTCNYMLGLLYSLTVGSTVYYIFGVYCFIFAFLWGGCSVAAWWFLTQLHKMEIGDIKHGGKNKNEDDPLDLGW